MTDDDFEWDDAKAADNHANHGVSFEAARAIFKDPFAIEYIDERYDYGETRWIIIGMAHDRLLLVAYTMREDRIRPISARAAESFEQRQYHEQNAQDDQT